MHGAVTVDDAQARASMREMAGAGLHVGECGAAPLAALRALLADPGCEPLRDALGVDGSTRALLLATEGRTSSESPDWPRADGSS
jgi:diaminopropionate ammonia-lyase